MKKLFVTYEICKPNGNVFYVGAGKSDRPKRHLREAFLIMKGSPFHPNANRHKIHTIIELIQNGTPPIINILFEGDRDTAFKMEKDLIKKYGRADLGLGPLTNLTDGGDLGNWGMKFSDETRSRFRAMRKGKKNPFYGKHHTSETRKILSEQRKAKYKGSGNPFYGKRHSEEMKFNHSKNLKEKFRNGEIVPKKHTEEHKKYLSKKYAGSNNPCAKKYIVTSPDGIEMTIKCLTEWCKTMNFSRNTFSGMLKHQKSADSGPAKGWSVRKA